MADEKEMKKLIKDLDGLEDIADEAVEKLVEIGEASIPYLIDALKDKYMDLNLRRADWRVQCRAALALGKIGDEKAIPALIAALDDRNDKVRYEAAKALEIIASNHPEYNWKEAVPHLIDALKDEDCWVRAVATESLAKIGKPAVPKLIEALKDEDCWVRGRAAEALGRIGDESATPYLVETLKDEDWWVRFITSGALREIAENISKKEDYLTALKLIKYSTETVIKLYEGKKDRDSLKERRKKLAEFESLAQQIYDKMNPDKKKFHKPIKHQPVRAIRKKVMTNG